MKTLALRLALSLALLLLTACAAAPPPGPPQPATTPPAQALPQPAGLHLSSLHMLDAHTGWALAGSSAVVRTADGGGHWADVTPPHLGGKGLTMLQAVSADTAYVAMAPDGAESVGVFATHDGGKSWQGSDGARTWQELSPDATLAALMQAGAGIAELDFVDAKTGWALMTNRSGGTWLLATADGGATWTPLPATAAR